MKTHTPRTDALWMNAKYEAKNSDNRIAAWSDFARQLERELAAMTADRDSWCQQNDQHVADAVAFSKQADAWREVAKRLAQELRDTSPYSNIEPRGALAAFDKLSAEKSP